ncbi:MAG TPA: crosslink repair DNA glycosylase YcaQ family protein [Candidatus Sulfotelmatobacter sp.]|nr:crosslink repair DNA glycosylase YcaQ family protein [Candidatus Sulfotelmatobacter sp.]
MPLSIDILRTYAVGRSLFPPTTLKSALHAMGFVQADPIRAPARAQDLILRHRVRNYRAGDLERRYHQLGVEEDFFINYGFVTREVQALMHPRLKSRASPWSFMTPGRRKRAELLLAFIRERGRVHPREVDQRFAHGKVTNYWGGSSNATTRLLDAMHYQGLLRVAGRDSGIRLYVAHEHGPSPKDNAERDARLDALVDVAVGIYAPLPERSLRSVVQRLRYATPQWEREILKALKRAKERLPHQGVAGVEWYWPLGEDPTRSKVPHRVRLLTPFDPVVWDRYRFELLWGWQYRFEAYTPIEKRVRGYYALPLLWRDRVIGWANVTTTNKVLRADVGYVTSAPRDVAFRRELEEELDRLKRFLRLAETES